MGDLTRRQFIGRTLITGATIASGGLSTISTTPTTPTVAKVATTFKNLNVLSPKAKAYRGFLKGLLGSARWYKREGGTSTKTLLTKLKRHNRKTGNIETVKTSYGRNAFETAIKKPEGSWTKMEAKQGVGNYSATNIAMDIKTNDRERRQGFPDPKNSSAGKETRKLTAQITWGARKHHAIELKRFRQANPDRMHKKVSARIHKENMKAKSKGSGRGGGGKMALPGLESARNPTGMSLLNRKSVLM